MRLSPPAGHLGRPLAAIGTLLATGATARVLWARRLEAVTEPAAPVVVAADGVGLHVEIDGDPSAPLTVVFCHGFAVRLGEFDVQCRALRDPRLVLYDHRGHGRSGWGTYRRATMEQLGDDLGHVVDACAPSGPVVLVGHSMGGMAIMALAACNPNSSAPGLSPSASSPPPPGIWWRD